MIMELETVNKLVKTLLHLKEKVKCAICLDVVKDVTELDCNHRYCNSCVNDLKSVAKKPLCPLCKKEIKKRCTVYKDLFTDKLSNFVSEACNVIRTEYGCEVELLDKDPNVFKTFTKTNILHKIGKGPKSDNLNTETKKGIAVDHNPNEQEILPPTLTANVPKDAFDKLLSSNSIRTYKNKTKQNNYQKGNIHSFDNQNNKLRVINWLNSNETRFNKITHSQKSNENHLFDEEVLDLPSISQVPPRTRHTLRSRSLDIETRKVSHAPLKKYKSLNSNLNDEDYTIEEINTEKFERNVIQDLLEDACLANIENMDITNKNQKHSVQKQNGVKGVKPKIPSVCSTNNGWNRIKDVKNSIKKRAKIPKQLNITIHSTSPQQNSAKKTSPPHINKKARKTKQLKKKAEKPEKAEVQEQNSAEKDREILQCFNLSAVEDYISTNIQNVGVLDISNSSDHAIADNQRSNIKNISKVDLKEQPAARNDEAVDDIFLMPTQKSACQHHEIAVAPTVRIQENTKDKSFQTHKTIDHIQENKATLIKLPIVPEMQLVSQDYKSLEHIISDLQDKIDECISHLTCESDTISKTLLGCFTNIKSYIEKIKDMNSQKVGKLSKGVQTIEKLKESIQTQTVLCTTAEKAIQSEEISSEKDKTFPFDVSVEAVGLTKNTSKTEGIEVKGENRPQTSSTRNSDNRTEKVPSISNKSQELCNRSFVNRRPNISLHKESISKKAHSQKKTTSIPAEPSNSPLVFSLDPTAPRNSKKINRKLTFIDTQSKRFKRIRMANSDSDSDEEHCNKKTRNKFIRDDLSIRFTESALPESGVKSQGYNSEANNVEYDKYLDEVLKKYDSPKHSPGKGGSTNICPEINDDDLNAICDKLIIQVRNRDDKPATQKHNPSPVKNPAFPKEVDEFDNAFSGDHIFSDPENLVKLDRDISQYQKHFKRDKVVESLEVIQNSIYSAPAPKKVKLDNDNTVKQHNTIGKTVGPQNINSDSLFANNSNLNNLEKQKHVTQEIVNDIFEDDQLDEELALISFTEEERKSALQKHQERVKILQNVKIKSQDKCKYTNQNVPADVCDSNDELFSDDDDVVETTPQETRRNNMGDVLTKIDTIDTTSFQIPTTAYGVSGEEDLNFDVCLPPPPGFGDDNNTSNSEQENSVIENNTNRFLNKSSLTPDILSEIVENPIKGAKSGAIRSQIIETENTPTVTVHNDPSLITPRRATVSRVDLSLVHSTPRSQTMNREILGLSPINKENTMPTPKEQPNLIEIAHNSKYMPLVTTKKMQTKKNIMTSVPNQKSILNYVRPSQEIKTVKKPCIAYTRILSKNEAIVSRLKAVDLVNVSTTFGPHVTHMVVLVDEQGCVKVHTAKFVLAVAAGIWVVRLEWIEDCLRNHCILPEEPYEALDVTGVPGPKMSRLTRISAPLLREYRFYCAPPFSNISREDAENAIKLLGGETVADLKELAQNEKSTNLIVTDTTATDDTEMFEYWLKKYKAVTVDVEWLTKSIGQYKVISVRPYVLCSDDSICDLGYPTHLIESVPLTFSENL